MSAFHTWEFSREPITLGQVMDSQKVAKGDYDALFRLLKARLVTDVSDAEILALHEDQLVLVLTRLNESLAEARNFRALVDRQGLQ